MADVKAATKTLASSVDYIDLTLSDNEDTAPRHSPLRASTSPSIDFLNGIDISPLPDALPLGGTFGLANGEQLGRLDLPPPKIVKAPPSCSSLHATWNSLRRGKSARNNFNNTPPPRYIAGDAKRRRTGHYELSSDSETENKKEREEISGTTPGLAEFPVPIDLLQTGQRMSKGAMNESLKVALREQVFPHINQRLGYYTLSVDSITRKELGKKAAWEICREKDFMEDLLENKGRLSSLFENKISGLAQSLVDQHVGDYLSTLNKSHGYHGPITPHIPDTEAPRRSNSNRIGSKVPLQSTKDEAAKVILKAKLSAIMKDRWRRGIMDRRRFKGTAKNREKQSKQHTGTSATRTLKHMRKPTVQSRAMPPVISIPPSSSSDEDVDRTRTSIFSSFSGKRPQRQNPLPRTLTSADTLNEGRVLPERDSITRSKIQPSRGRAAQAGREASRALLNSRRSRLRQFSMPQVQEFENSAVPAKSHSPAYQIEKLRVAGHDHRAQRPYLSWQDRRDIQRGLAIMQSGNESNKKLSNEELFSLSESIIHVDFCKEEIEHLIEVVESITGETSSLDAVDSKTGIENIMRGREEFIPHILLSLREEPSSHESFRSRFVWRRQDSAVEAFLRDAAAGLLSAGRRITRIGLRSLPGKNLTPEESITSILREREALGRSRDSRRGIKFQTQLINRFEDNFIREAEWADCAGDIATITWLDDENFFCGATAHSDEHNMQYNKPGNLLVGSISKRTLNSVSGHQVVRPIVSRGENSLASMRGTQDPWMYCSVTSTAYCPSNKKCFTGSYDQTVRVWDIAEDGSSLSLCGVWNHSGNVNFVAASPHHGLVATAADVCEDAVRVYHFDASDVSASAYNIYEASVQRRNSSDTWAYFPATMQWGLSSSVTHLLLVGYSPRSFNCYDMEIPEERANTGELCLWDTRDGSRILITSARTQNVFEVAWHPSQPIFVAATSPMGVFEDWVNTQLRLFGQTTCGSFSHMKTLDCPAQDINEISIMPNSIVQCYVTASCTDGNTYVWDSAICDKPIHTLRHGESIDDQSHGSSREEADTGVKFATWGKSPHRFYTGSSDGVVKAWNIRASPGEAFVRDVITMSGGISTGKFSPDFSKLVIGDSTGKVHYLSFSDFSEAIRAPIKPHHPLPAPLIDNDDQEIEPEQTAKECAERFLQREQIVIHPDEYIGAIQGPNYEATGLLYKAEKYRDENENSKGWSTQELEAKQRQRYNVKRIEISQLLQMHSSDQLSHEKNLGLDFDFSTLSFETADELKTALVDFRLQLENSFQLELGPCMDLEKEESPCRRENSLQESEIDELEALAKRISQELKIHKGLKELLL